MGLSREAASEVLETIPPERIERIENEKFQPHPDEVLLMAERYRAPMLCNNYCAQQCPIGREYVPKIKIKDLSQIVLEMLASLNSMQCQTTRLIDIAVDGGIDNEELKTFIHIQQKLECISFPVGVVRFTE